MKLKLLGISALIVSALAVALSGCGTTTACEKAGNHPTHACYVEIQNEKRELKKSEYGSVKAANEAEHDEQVEEELGEVEEIIKHRQAEGIANTLEGR